MAIVRPALNVDADPNVVAPFIVFVPSDNTMFALPPASGSV